MIVYVMRCARGQKRQPAMRHGKAATLALLKASYSERPVRSSVKTANGALMYIAKIVWSSATLPVAAVRIARAA